jgi:hypothetical protein
MFEVRKAAHVEGIHRRNNSHEWFELYGSVRIVFMYMYAGLSGDNCVCT